MKTFLLTIGYWQISHVRFSVDENSLRPVTEAAAGVKNDDKDSATLKVWRKEGIDRCVKR